MRFSNFGRRVQLLSIIQMLSQCYIIYGVHYRIYNYAQFIFCAGILFHDRLWDLPPTKANVKALQKQEQKAQRAVFLTGFVLIFCVMYVVMHHSLVSSLASILVLFAWLHTQQVPSYYDINTISKRISVHPLDIFLFSSLLRGLMIGLVSTQLPHITAEPPRILYSSLACNSFSALCILSTVLWSLLLSFFLNRTHLRQILGTPKSNQAFSKSLLGALPEEPATLGSSPLVLYSLVLIAIIAAVQVVTAMSFHRRMSGLLTAAYNVYLVWHTLSLMAVEDQVDAAGDHSTEGSKEAVETAPKIRPKKSNKSHKSKAAAANTASLSEPQPTTTARESTAQHASA